MFHDDDGRFITPRVASRLAARAAKRDVSRKKRRNWVGGCSTLVLALFAALVIAAIAGWVMNIVALCNCDFKEPYRTEALRGIGIIVAPMGAVEGYMDLEDVEPTKP